MWCKSDTAKNKIKILVRNNWEGVPIRISGWCGNTEVFSVHPVCGNWSTATSVCLPSDIYLAKKYVDTMNQVLVKLDEIINSGY